MTEHHLPCPSRVVVIGSVTSSERVLRSLAAHHLPVVGVLGLDPSVSRGVAGYVDLVRVAGELGIEASSFKRANDPATLAAMDSWNPDLIFAVGLSQLLGPAYTGRLGCRIVGFHPTLLPAGRGRAPIAWAVLGHAPPAATFFLIDAGTDSGPIIHQVALDAGSRPSAESLLSNVLEAIDESLRQWLPTLMQGQLLATSQDHSRATWLGGRTDSDGHIDWATPASEIDRLVRAAGRPHPGAYTFLGGKKVRVWRVEVARDTRVAGVPGRVLLREADGSFFVQTGDLPIRVLECEFDSGEAVEPKIGQALGYRVWDEVHILRSQVHELQEEILRIKKQLDREM